MQAFDRYVAGIEPTTEATTFNMLAPHHGNRRKINKNNTLVWVRQRGPLPRSHF